MILRSAFWLTIGFLVVAPHGTDFGAAATSLKDQAITAAADAGTQLVVSQLSPAKYSSSALLDIASSIVKPAALPMQDSPTAPLVFPRPRPAAMG